MNDIRIVHLDEKGKFDDSTLIQKGSAPSLRF